MQKIKLIQLDLNKLLRLLDAQHEIKIPLTKAVAWKIELAVILLENVRLSTFICRLTFVFSAF